MKGFKKLAVILLSILTLGVCMPMMSSCSDLIDSLMGTVTGEKGQTLDTPHNLRVEDGCLCWNPVEFATKYTVSIDGKEYIAEDCKYSLANVKDGEHIFKVKANGDGVLYNTSGYSDEYKETLVSGAVSQDYSYKYFEELSENESFLGYGFDVINSSVFSDKYVKTSFPIFNKEKLMQQRLLKVDSKQTYIDEIQSSDMESFMQQWNANLNVGVSWGGKRFGGSVDVEAKYSGGTEKTKSKYFHNISFNNQEFYIVMQSDMNTYKQILSEGFYNDLYSDMEPAVLFDRYGTHFITSAVMGGKINSYYLYTSEQEKSFHDISAQVSVEVRQAKTGVNVDVSGGYRQEATNQNIYIKNTLEVIGGGDFGMISDADIASNYLEWEKSLDSKAALMGIKDTGSLIPIWELIDSKEDTNLRTYTDITGKEVQGTRAQQLQAYFEKYGIEAYNELMESASLPEIIMPESIDNIRVNNTEAVNGEYEVFAGSGNDISFTVGPDKATGYTKTASLSSSTEYATINNENGLSLEISADCPHNTAFDIVVSAGSVRKTIKVRVIKRYTVTFETNTDEDIAPLINIRHGRQINRPTDPIKEGYVLQGWYTDPNFAQGTEYVFGEQAVTDNMTLYAKWVKIGTETEKTVQVASHANTPSYAIKPATTMGTFLYDEKAPQNLPKNAFKIDGWIFKGWATAEDGNVVYEDQAKLDNIAANETSLNLYAVWVVDPCTIGQYVPNGVVISDTNGENSYTVYNTIDATPWNPPAGKTIIDWSKEMDTNLLNHTNRVVQDERYNNIDITNEATEVTFVGDVSKTYINFRIALLWFNDAFKLRFVNFNYITNDPWESHAAILLHEDKGIQLIIEVVGECSIGTNYPGCNLIFIDTEGSSVNIIGSGNLKLTAGDGADATTAGGNGSNGGVAIIADKLTIDMTGSLIAKGGNGGNGATGSKGADQTGQPSEKSWFDYSNGSQGYSGGDGSDGGNGGDGGNSINVSKIEVLSGNCLLIGGTSGAGGDGGEGGKGGNGGNSSCWGYWGGKGGTGGKGGDGGDAGKIGNDDEYKKSLNIYVAQGANVEIKSGELGKKGKGGTGGTGGDGGKGSSDIGNYNTNFGAPGDKGAPGEDGNGAD